MANQRRPLSKQFSKRVFEKAWVVLGSHKGWCSTSALVSSRAVTRRTKGRRGEDCVPRGTSRGAGTSGGRRQPVLSHGSEGKLACLHFLSISNLPGAKPSRKAEATGSC